MLETIVELAVYLILGLAGLAVAGWGNVRGQFLELDGLFLVLVSLTLSLVFLAAFALGLRRGEFADVTAILRGRRKSPEPASQPTQSTTTAGETRSTAD